MLWELGRKNDLGNFLFGNIILTPILLFDDSIFKERTWQTQVMIRRILVFLHQLPQHQWAFSTSKHKSLIPAFAMADMDQPHLTSLTRSSCWHPRSIVAPSKSNHSSQQSKSCPRSVLIQSVWHYYERFKKHRKVGSDKKATSRPRIGRWCYLTFFRSRQILCRCFGPIQMESTSPASFGEHPNS